MRVSQKQTVDIDFSNISYTVNKNRSNTILKGVSGHFQHGNLIGILGPSGAGKTTLLNILAGYISNNVNGLININGQIRNMRKFKKISCYIMQEDVVQKQLSVDELMTMVARLKLGNRFTAKEKCKIIKNVVKTIGLEPCLKTRTENLSGGQLKRLTIALELINNPPVMFLDEPTTGLDNVVAKQCIELLKTLANQGRTIICTIHQPPDSLFSFFDQVYFMASGQCVYTGGVGQMVPFLERVSLPCPTNYNPADYIIELVSNNEKMIETLSEATGNGILTINERGNKEPIILSRENTYQDLFTKSDFKSNKIIDDFPNPFHVQVGILLKRMFIQMGRNKLMLSIQLIHHVISSLSLGLSFFWIGDDASQVLANFKFFLGITVFYCYTYIMSPILLFPFEIQLIKREYFNRWYSLKAYYTALTISNIPPMVVFTIVFNVIVYTLTNQPMEVRRFIFFNIVSLLINLNSYGLGITIGSIFNSKEGACVGSTMGMYLILMAMYGMGYRDTIPVFTKVLMLMTFPRHGVIGFSATLLQERPLMKCNDEELFCYIRDPQELLHLMGMGEAKLDFAIYMLIIFLVFHRVTAYVALKFKVEPDCKLICKYF